MAVTIIRGRSGSGKSRYLKEHIRSIIKDPLANVIVITAGSLTFETERSIISNCGINGILGLQVFSIQRLAYAILEESQEFMTNADKAMVCKKALLSLDNPFHGAANTPDFISCLSSLISKLKDYNQTPQSLREIKTNDPALKQKLSDTADVLEQYINLCGNKKDTGDMYALAANRAQNAQLLKDAHIIIDGMDSFSPAVMLLIKNVIKISSDVIIAFRSKGSGSEHDLFSAEESDMYRFIEAAKSAGEQPQIIELDESNQRYSCEELKYLEKTLYSYPYQKYQQPISNIRLYEAQTIDEEVDIITAGILNEVASGKKYSDIAVVIGNLQNYIPSLKMKLNLCNIPYFIDERRTLADNTFFDFLYRSLLAAAGDALYIPNYVYNRYCPISNADKYTLRKYAQNYSYKGWHFYNTFWRGDKAEQAEDIRARVMHPLKKLSDKLSSNNPADKIQAIRQFLSDCDAKQKIDEFIETLINNEMNSQAEYFAQVFEKTTEVLDGLYDVFINVHLSSLELIELIKTGCEATKIAIIPPSTDEVGIFDISVARLKNIDILFAAGVQDGVWPAKPAAPEILSEAERQTLFESGVDLGISDLNAEKLKIYTALVKPKDRLYISYNNTSSPSVLIDRIKKIFPVLETQKETALSAECTDNSLVLSKISRAIQTGELDDSLINTCSNLIQQPGWLEHTKNVLSRTNAAQTLSEQTALKLYGGIKCSATRIESYYKCPFSHFVSRGIKARPQREYVGDSLDTGSFLHFALDIFAQYLLSDHKDIKELSKAQVAEAMTKAASEAAEKYDNAKLLEDERFSSLYNMLTKELIRTAHKIQYHFTNTKAEIYSSEQEFSNYTINTKYGEVTITGKIDRIDTAGSYFRVVDYKSSKKVFSISEFANGVSLQLPVYIEATKRLLKNSEQSFYPAGGYYMQIGEGFAETQKDLNQDGRLFGVSLNDTDVLESFSSINEDGSFAAIDQRMTSKGELHGQAKNKFFTSDELDKLLIHTNELIRNAAEGIYSGRTDIAPVDEAFGTNVCTYCEYKSVCQKDSGFAANETRKPEPFDKSNLEAGE